MVKEEFELFRTAWSRFASCELQTHCTFLFYFILFFFFTSVGLLSYSYFHSHFPSLFHSHYDYHYDYLYRYGYRYHS